MTKTFTENDLIRFLYDELNADDALELKQALMTNTDLQNKLNDLRLVVKELDTLQLSPSKTTLDNILGFSKGYLKESV